MLPNCAMHVTVSSGHHVNELRKINLDNVFVEYSNRLRASVSFLYPLKGGIKIEHWDKKG